MMPAEILPCNCVHKGQDDLHGKGNRVFNEELRGANSNERSMKCTVCGNTKHVKK
jgi:hypothetical protein